jgi:protein SCO1/2
MLSERGIHAASAGARAVFGTALAAAFLCFGLVACRQQPRSASSAPTQQVFSVKGIVKEVKPATKQVTIEHEKIPNYMDAMTMDFEVRNTNELTGLQVNDYISFRMTVTDKDAWIDRITRLATTQPVVANAPDNFRRVREVEPLKIGDPLPEYHFTNEMGQSLSLGDYKGQAVAITFIFTRCPFPTFCPRMASNLEEAYKKLKADPECADELAPVHDHV